MCPLLWGWACSLPLRFRTHHFSPALYFWKLSHGSVPFPVTGFPTSPASVAPAVKAQSGSWAKDPARTRWRQHRGAGTRTRGPSGCQGASEQGPVGLEGDRSTGHPQHPRDVPAKGRRVPVGHLCPTLVPSMAPHTLREAREEQNPKATMCLSSPGVLGSPYRSC